ncbi:MAG: 4-hydroxythreonine-4-phosphate dehydrogenase PdxA [Flavobacteriaceae bacterium]|nr:4-hydroxythreonine-4-phosphate dehydrogenase PdxA [Bacteroidia bacterium]NNL15815.1 4-hydroxythreonine-4-phosphate dehydrogenase PdxA [Flavobacteriaceae bacterium]
MKREEKLKVGISIGDPNGIGGEVIIKTFEDARMLDFCTPIIFASVKVITYLKKHFRSNLSFQGINQPKQAINGKINVVNVWRENFNIEFGKESKIAGELSFKSLEAATSSLINGDIDVLITAPINKHNIQSDEFDFPGHTDYLAKRLEGNSLMFMITDNLKVGLLTDHVPLKDIASHISPELVENKINIIDNTLKQDFGINKPKIAVLGINPHTGDKGVIGNEDDKILRPTLNKIKESGRLVFGPYAADSFFGSDNFKNFDAIIATYHDQGLIPFKTLSFGKGVNFTAGLNKIRTSPDHGTAYEIAGKGLADPSSFKEAIFEAIHIFNKRKEFIELSANPLKKATK